MTRLIEMTPENLPAALAVISQTERNPRLDLAWLRYRALEDASCLPELRLLAEVDGQIVGFCLACLREERGIVKLFGVTESYRKRGIATALFDEIEARLRARNAQQIVVEGVSPNYCVPGVDLRQNDAVCFLLHRGYETDRTARVDMEVDLLQADLSTAADEARLAQEGIVARRASPGEVEAASQFALAHFSSAWRQEVADAAAFTPTPLFIARQGDEIISFAAYDVGGPSRFGPTGTHPDYRRRGIGGVLLKLCMRTIRDRGEALAEISWVGPIQFYADVVGARIHRVYWNFRKAMSVAAQP